MMEGTAESEMDTQDGEDEQPDAGPSNGLRSSNNSPGVTPMVMPKSEPPVDQLPTVVEDNGEQGDFDFVRKFFASGAGDNGGEDDVWRTMTERVSAG